MEEPETMCVYALEKNDIPFYIGITKNIKERIWAHRSEAKYSNSGMYQFFPPEFTFYVIDEVSKSEWQFWEKYYISLYKSWGIKLVNLTDGGDMPPPPKPIRPSRKIPIYCKCVNCGKFYETRSRHISKYCSRKCSYKVKYEKGKTLISENKKNIPPAPKENTDVSTIRLKIKDFNTDITALIEQAEIIGVRRGVKFPITKKACCTIKFYLKGEDTDTIMTYCNFLLTTLVNIKIITNNPYPITIKVDTNTNKSECDLFVTF